MGIRNIYFKVRSAAAKGEPEKKPVSARERKPIIEVG